MQRFMILTALMLGALTVSPSTRTIAAPPNGWSPVVIATGPYRSKIQAMPIESRPGRPLHVYGNTVRMFRHADTTPVRPVRQIFWGTHSVRSGPRR